MDVLMALLLMGSRPALVDNQTTEVLSEQHCLASNIYFEARSEIAAGKKAVAQVTLNRVNSGKYPKTICAVVLQHKQFSWTHQVPREQRQRALSGLAPLNSELESLAYAEAKTIAKEAMNTSSTALPNSVLWYHTTEVHPAWNKRMSKVKVIGSHVFYKHKIEGKI